MNDIDRELIDCLVKIERERLGDSTPQQPTEPHTIHYTELPEDRSNDPTARDWNFYLLPT